MSKLRRSSVAHLQTFPFPCDRLRVLQHWIGIQANKCPMITTIDFSTPPSSERLIGVTKKLSLCLCGKQYASIGLHMWMMLTKYQTIDYCSTLRQLGLSRQVHLRSCIDLWDYNCIHTHAYAALPFHNCNNSQVRYCASVQYKHCTARVTKYVHVWGIH